MVFWSEPTTTEDDAAPAVSKHEEEDEDDVLLDKGEDEDTAPEADVDEDEGSCGVTWDDAEQFSAAVLASIPRTATAKLAAAVALFGYLVYMKARLDKCVA